MSGADDAEGTASRRPGQATGADAVAMVEYVRGGCLGAPLRQTGHAAVLLATEASGEALHLLDRRVNEIQGDAT